MKPIALTLLGVVACCGSAWSAATPPPTNVHASEIRAVDARTAHRSVAVYASWLQLPCLQPARGPL